jgi:hypothetical protein
VAFELFLLVVVALCGPFMGLLVLVAPFLDRAWLRAQEEHARAPQRPRLRPSSSTGVWSLPRQLLFAGLLAMSVVLFLEENVRPVPWRERLWIGACMVVLVMPTSLLIGRLLDRADRRRYRATDDNLQVEP